MNKNDVFYFAVKTKFESKDGKIEEGYVSYDFEHDEVSLTSPFDFEFVCVYMSSKTANEIADKIRKSAESTKKIADLLEASVEVENVEITTPNLLKKCSNGATHYYVSTCI